MAKQQFISLLATVFTIGTNLGEPANANASSVGSNQSQSSIQSLKRSPDLSSKEQYQLAQQPASNAESDDEMLDALQKRQEKLEKIKELGELNKLLQQENTLNTLQEENFNVNTLEELEAVRAIISDKNSDPEEMLVALQQQDLNIDLQQLKQLRAIVGTQPAIASESGKMSSTLAFRIWTIGLPVTILTFLVATPFVKGIVGVAKKKYQKTDRYFTLNYYGRGQSSDRYLC